MPADIWRALAPGLQAYYARPIAVIGLLAALDRLLSKTAPHPTTGVSP